jgi:hypothetical protein
VTWQKFNVQSSKAKCREWNQNLRNQNLRNPRNLPNPRNLVVKP